MGNRAYKLRTRYNLTEGEYEDLLKFQDGVCAVCHRVPSPHKHGGTFHVEHCHDTGLVRGLICGSENVALGMLGDDPERVIQVLQYLLDPPGLRWRAA